MSWASAVSGLNERARDAERSEREHEALELERAIEDLACGKHREPRQHHDREDLDQRARHRASGADAQFLVKQTLIRGIEPAHRGLLRRRGLHAAQPLHRLVASPQEILLRPQGSARAAANAASELSDDDRDRRRDEKRRKRQAPVEPDRGAEPRETAGELRDRASQQRHESDLQFRRIADDPADQFRRASGDDLRHRQRDDMPEGIEPDPRDGAGDHAAGEVLVQEVRRRPEHGQDEQPAHDQRHAGEWIRRQDRYKPLGDRRELHRLDVGLGQRSQRRAVPAFEDDLEERPKRDESRTEAARRDEGEADRPEHREAVAEHPPGKGPKRRHPGSIGGPTACFHRCGGSRRGRVAHPPSPPPVNRSSRAQNRGSLLVTTSGSAIAIPGRTSPSSENAMAIR